MKYVIILGDGMADEPIPSLNGKTPLQAADTPTFDYMAPRSRMGMLKTVPEDSIQEVRWLICRCSATTFRQRLRAVAL